MRIAIGLPNPVLDVPGTLLIDWARRAEERGSFHDRGRRLDADLELLHQAWAGGPWRTWTRSTASPTRSGPPRWAAEPGRSRPAVSSVTAAG